MASWETEKVQSTFNAQDVINNTTSNRDSGRSGANSTTSSSGGGLFGFGAYSVVGLNVASVPEMCEAINTWVEGIQTHLDNIDPLADASNAFRSEENQVENAVQGFAENVKEYCKNLCSDLLAFSDKIRDVRDAWIKTTGNVAGTIQSDTAASDAGSRYQESIR